MDKKNFGMDPKRYETTTSETTNEKGRCVHLRMEKQNVQLESDLSSTSSMTPLDGCSERTNRMEFMLDPAQ
ncbi:hypothetical protein Y032_0006g3014 [Ancylostoma ceylanicum]|uniref:Uncharacterized protein n=1 Tax=Ancylostoma ceylanicum TaxID=53326 RepID=A0A016VQ37_9BILA|nr:hypothetical protein Y032_0006g3014 [Ancylostoma ceylanicum]